MQNDVIVNVHILNTWLRMHYDAYVHHSTLIGHIYCTDILSIAFDFLWQI